MSPPTAIVRRPSPLLAEGIVTHVEREPVDAARAMRQWEDYVGVLRHHDWRIVEAEPVDDCPDGVFVEDAAVVLGGQAILTRPGAPRRRAELASMATALAGLGLEPRAIEAPAVLDGGDVMAVGRTVYVGIGDRTDAAGAQQLRGLLAEGGMSVVPVPITRVLHLKSAATSLPDGAVIGHPPALEDPAIFDSFLAAPEEAGAHVVDLGGGALLMAAGAPRTAELLAARGYRPELVDIGEFEKLEGCVTCLAVLVDNAPARRDDQASPKGGRA